MSEVLKLPQLSQDNSVAEMNIGCRWINTKLHSERPAESQLFAQLSFTDDLCGTFSQQGEGVIALHRS